jgi:hypothetical protein
MNSRKTETGSAHIVIIIILVVALLGTLGFVFWQNFLKPKTDTAQTITTSTSTTKTVVAADPYAGWLSYSSDRAAFSVQYPADWKVTDASATGGDLVHLMSPNIVKEQNNSPDAANYDIEVSFESTTGSMIATQLDAVSALKLSQKGSDFSQYATKKYTETVNSISVTEFNMVAQSPYFAAIFPIGNNYVQVSFPYAPTKADLTATLSSILASFKAN